MVSAYTLVAMLSKETGIMVLPMVVIYQVICKQNHMTNMYTEKSKARTVFKYVLMVTTNGHISNHLLVYSRPPQCCFSEHP